MQVMSMSARQVAVTQMYMPRGVIHPRDGRYRMWWWLTIVAVAFTVWYEPYVMAFAATPGSG